MCELVVRVFVYFQVCVDVCVVRSEGVFVWVYEYVCCTLRRCVRLCGCMCCESICMFLSLCGRVCVMFLYVSEPLWTCLCYVSEPLWMCLCCTYRGCACVCVCVSVCWRVL